MTVIRLALYETVKVIAAASSRVRSTCLALDDAAAVT